MLYYRESHFEILDLINERYLFIQERKFKESNDKKRPNSIKNNKIKTSANQI